MIFWDFELDASAKVADLVGRAAVCGRCWRKAVDCRVALSSGFCGRALDVLGLGRPACNHRRKRFAGIAVDVVVTVVLHAAWVLAICWRADERLDGLSVCVVAFCVRVHRIRVEIEDMAISAGDCWAAAVDQLPRCE